MDVIDKGIGKDKISVHDKRAPEDWLRLAGLRLPDKPGGVAPRGDLPGFKPPDGKPPGILPPGGITPPDKPEPPELIEIDVKELARLKAVEASFLVMNATAKSGEAVPLTGYAGPTPAQYNTAKTIAEVAVAAAPEPEPEEPPVEPDPAPESAGVGSDR